MLTCLLVGIDVLTKIGLIMIPGVLLLVGFIWAFFLERSFYKEKKEIEVDKENFQIEINHYVIRTMILFVAIIGVFALLCVVLYLANVPDYLSFGETLGFTCVFGVVAIIVAAFTGCVRRWRVYVRGDKIIHVPCIGKKREFLWGDISKVVKNRPPMGDNIILKIYINQNKKPEFTANGFMTGVVLLDEKLIKSGKLFL